LCQVTIVVVVFAHNNKLESSSEDGCDHSLVGLKADEMEQRGTDRGTEERRSRGGVEGAKLSCSIIIRDAFVFVCYLLGGGVEKTWEGEKCEREEEQAIIPTSLHRRRRRRHHKHTDIHEKVYYGGGPPSQWAWRSCCVGPTPPTRQVGMAL